MGNEAEIVGPRQRSPWRVAGWTIAGIILLVPIVAMQFTREVNWSVGDFIFAAIMIGSVGLLFELTVRASPNRSFRGGVAAALFASFLIIWANGAVGMIGDEDNPYNLLFLAVICVALLGATIASFRPTGMAAAMLAAGIAHGAIAIGGMPFDMRGGTISLFLSTIWLFSAALLRNAGKAQS